MATTGRRELLISRASVQAVILVVLAGFFVLGLLAYRTYQRAWLLQRFRPLALPRPGSRADLPAVNASVRYCWCAGRKTRNEAPPPGLSCTHARPPWSAVNCATSDRPTPVPVA